MELPALKGPTVEPSRKAVGPDPLDLDICEISEYWRPGVDPLEREKFLWLCVLLRAAQDLRGSHSWGNGYGASSAYAVQLDAARWFRSKERQPGCFLWILDILGWSEDYWQGLVKRYLKDAA